MDTKYIPVIGLEIHVELKTESGMFCQCKINQFEAHPNSHVCPVCLGLPGALPVANKKAIEWTIKIGQALHCTINRHTKFDRKHYSYPDLPKGYQISQYDKPIAISGHLDFEKKSFRIHRVHLEEDTGKLIHRGNDTFIDFNRSGTPLVEIVTEPDFESSEDVKMFLEELHTIIRYLDVSDADMEKGTMRMEPNISVKRVTCNADRFDGKLPNYKVEVKNINSFNFVKRAIDFEVKRHIDLLEQGKTPVQETRGWNSEKNVTYSQRIKEEAHDYRYFPEPDIPPFTFSEEYLENIAKSVPELPMQRVKRYEKMGIKHSDAYILTRSKELCYYFETVLAEAKKESKELAIEQKIASIIINKRISSTISSKEFVMKFLELTKPVETDITLLNSIVTSTLDANSKVVTEYKSGKQTVIMFLVGQVMKQMKGKADASIVRKALERKMIE